MATTSTATSNFSGTVTNLVVKKVLENLRANYAHAMPGNFRPEQFFNGTNGVFTWTTYADQAAQTTALTEGTPPTAQALTIATESATASQYGATYEITDLAVLQNPHNLLIVGTDHAADQASKTIDVVVRDIIAAGASVLYGGTATSRATVASSHVLTGALVKRLAARARRDAGWHGILVGDMSQPRGGPMLTGHASHQVGLDADIWLTPMPGRRLSRNEREEMSAVMMVRADRLDIDPHTWTPTHLAVIRAAAQEPSVQRIFVNAAIKKALCREAKGDRSWLHKVRPMYGHDYHFHIRIKCPPGAGECDSQPEPNESEGCSTGDLAYWFSDAVLHPKPPKVPPKPKPPMTMAALPPACKTVLHAPDAKQ